MEERQDLISRQAAIYAVYTANGIGTALKALKQLPSAQPEPSEITDEQAILHLQSTGWMQRHDKEMYESGLREQLADDSGSYDSLIPCEDTISRQVAIDALMAEPLKRDDSSVWESARCYQWMMDMDAIKALPSAQPEPCGDAVSRQYILNALAEYIEEYEELDKGEIHDPKWCAMKEAEIVVKEAPSAQPEIVRCKDCEYGEQDEVGRWFCRSLGCQIGDEDGSGFCADAERRTDA